MVDALNYFLYLMRKRRQPVELPASAKLAHSDLPYALIMVEWVDASRLHDGWMDLAAIPQPYAHRCVTVNFLVSENERGKILLPTIGDIEHADNSHTYGGMMIPRSSIISERRLR